MEAIRQDKLGYILTVFRTEGIHPEIQLSNPLEYLITTIVSQRVHFGIHNIAFKKLINYSNNYETLAITDSEVIANWIQPTKFAFNKASIIKSLLIWTYQTFRKYSIDGIDSWSDEKILTSLSKIKGMNLKMISRMMCFSLGRDIFPMDTCVHRVFSRIGVSGKKSTPEQLFSSINSVMPYGKSHFLYRNVLKFGQKFCRSGKPDCGECTLREICDFNLLKNDWVTL